MAKDEVQEPVVDEPAVEVEETVTESVEISDELVAKIADQVKAGLEKAEEKEAVVVKDLGNLQTADEMSKELKTFHFIKGLISGTVEKLADAMDTTDTAEVLPPAEFTADVQRLEAEYGVSLRDATIRRTTKRSVLINKKASDVTVYETGEGVAKTTTSMDFTQIEITLRKYAGIAPLTDELLEDSAVDLYAELTNSFARAFAKVADELVFTDTTSGLLADSGVVDVDMASAKGFDDITFDNLVDMVYAIPASALAGAKFYMHRSILGVIQKIKDENNNYIWANGANGIAGGSIWGYPYELVEVMPEKTDDAPSTSFIVFGNLKYVTLLERTQMQMTILREGTVGTINLGEQDATALRAVKRFNAKATFANAFSRLTTSSTIS